MKQKNKSLLESEEENELNEEIKTFIKENKVLIPIAPIAGIDNLYLVGTVRLFIENDAKYFNQLMVRVEGGHQPLSDYIN